MENSKRYGVLNHFRKSKDIENEPSLGNTLRYPNYSIYLKFVTLFVFYHVLLVEHNYHLIRI
jgi:hypothetical protein